MNYFAHINGTTGELLGWYTKELHGDIPEPAVEVSEAQWKEAIGINANFYNEQEKKFEVKDFRTKEGIKRHKADTLKAMRDLALTESDFFIQRHTEEKMLGLKPTLSSDEMDKLLAYRQKLRDLTDSASFLECELPQFPIEIL